MADKISALHKHCPPLFAGSCGWATKRKTMHGQVKSIALTFYSLFRYRDQAVHSSEINISFHEKNFQSIPYYTENHACSTRRLLELSEFRQEAVDLALERIIFVDIYTFKCFRFARLVVHFRKESADH